MEQLDTDDKKLVENSKDKKKSQDYSKYVLIGVMCLVVLFALIFIFNYIKNQGSAGQTDSSKKIYFLIYFLYNRQKISSTNS